MEISFSQSFLDGLERIDNKVVIDGFSANSGDIQTSFQVVCHEEKVQVCVEGISGECGRLDFYCGEEIGFTIIGEGIAMNPERTIFEFNLPSEPKALIECPWVTEDTKFLEGVGLDLGNSLYKDIPVSEGSLVWKETIGKYIVDRGIQDNHLFDVELLDTKSGILEERPIKFKSYQNIRIEQGNFEIDMIKKSVVVKHDVYDEISTSSFFVWDSPMTDAKVNLEETPNCIDMIGEYVDPGNIIFGNTDCFQFINYTSSLVGFRVTGTEGSRVEVLFNRASTSGGYTSFEGTIGEEGSVEIRFSDLPYLHLNGIRSTGPSRVTKIETIMYLEETVDDYSPNPDKTYVTKLNNVGCVIDINGVADYIEYEKYLGEVNEIGRGTEHIDNIPGLEIRPSDNGNLNYVIKGLEKQVLVEQGPRLGPTTRYAVFQVSIENNIEVNGNIITTSSLYADYKIKIEQTGTIWKIYNSPDYINGEDGYGIYLLGHQEGSQREIMIMTNSPYTPALVANQTVEGGVVFKVDQFSDGTEIIDGERWYTYGFYIETLSDNESDDWRPKISGTNNPCLITFTGHGDSTTYVSLYAIQLRTIENPIEVWEETIIPGKFTKAESSITLLNTMTKNFIAVKEGGEGVTGLNWYYYDILGTNRFYLTDQSFQVTNVGPEYLVAPDTTLLDLGTGELRSTFGRVINVNRSDMIGSLGSLVVTETSAFPGTWRDLINNNTVSLEVNRELDNIYVRVGNSVENLKNEDYVVDIDSINVFEVIVESNFKYVIQTYGYIRIFPDDPISEESGYDFPDRREVFREYDDRATHKFVLVELDEDKEMGESYIEIRSGSIVRKITLNIVGPKKEHDYLKYFPPKGERLISQPNLIRIFPNGTVSPTDEQTLFRYISTTTPKIEVEGINQYQDTTDPLFTNNDGEQYEYHKSKVLISVPNAKALSYSKYPMKKFGYIREMSQDYSDSELLLSIDSTSYLEYPLYMKGKEHYLWCVDSLGEFSSISEPTDDSRFDMVINANGESGKMIYVVSRYSIDNRTFITEYPDETEFKIKRDELEANIKISPQQNIGLDERSQIEYAIPIQVSCNVENNRGNIFLGSLDYKAETKITDDSLSDVIEVDSNIATLEGIDSKYIRDYITKDRTQNLSIMIFQLGTDKTVFDIYSGISDLGIWATSNYIIPEIGSDYTITGLEVTKSSGPTSPIDGSLIGGEDIVTVTSEWDPKYFLVKVDSKERVRDDGSYWHWYPANNLPYKLIKDTDHTINIKANYKKEDGQTGVYNKFISFKKYGCNYGLYVDGYVGFGVTEDHTLSGCSAYVQVPNEGGSILVHAGIFHAVNGIDSTEALIVPSKYEFIGENQPLDFSWVNGNLDDDGNLRIVLPPRTRDEDGDKIYVLEVTQPHEYYPMKLYVEFYQTSLHGTDPDTNKEDYKLMFLDDKIDVRSDGTVVNGDGKLHFVSNLSEDMFDKLWFSWNNDDGIPSGHAGKDSHGVYINEADDLSLEVVEKSFRESYVKFKFKPNGSKIFIDGEIEARIPAVQPTQPTIVIGSIKIKQGFYCLEALYNSTSGGGSYAIYNHLSRLSPKLIYLGVEGNPPQGYYITSNSRPCKSQNDNSSASSSFACGRGVISLTAYRREYNESAVTEYSASEVVRDVSIISISPTNSLESYSMAYTESVENDDDAKVDPRFFEGEDRYSSTNFDQYAPYLELCYTSKEEYIRENAGIMVTCKVSVIELDTGNMVNYYFMYYVNKMGSDEPQNIDLLKFSDETLNFDYRGGTKQVSFNPASFGSMFTVTQMTGTNWVTFNLPSDSNYISITANENKTTDDVKAFFRTGQIKLDVKDPRDDYILGSFYINVNQEPDITQTSGGSGGGGDIGNIVKIYVTLVNNRAEDIELSGEITLIVSDGSTNGYISANLPGTNPQANNFTISANSSSVKYTVECTGLTGADPEDYISGSIIGYYVNKYIGDGESSSSALSPYTMTRDDGGNLTFNKKEDYTITFS